VAVNYSTVNVGLEVNLT